MIVAPEGAADTAAEIVGKVLSGASQVPTSPNAVARAGRTAASVSPMVNAISKPIRLIEVLLSVRPRVIAFLDACDRPSQLGLTQPNLKREMNTVNRPASYLCVTS